MRSSWIRVDPKSNDTCPYERQEQIQRHTGEKAMEDGGRD